MECDCVNSSILWKNIFFRAPMCLITCFYYCNQHHTHIFDVSHINDNTTSNEHRVPPSYGYENTKNESNNIKYAIHTSNTTVHLVFFLLCTIAALEPGTRNIQHWTHQAIVCQQIESDEPCIQCSLYSEQCIHAELLLVQYYRCICSQNWMCNWSGNERYDTYVSKTPWMACNICCRWIEIQIRICWIEKGQRKKKRIFILVTIVIVTHPIL